MSPSIESADRAWLEVDLPALVGNARKVAEVTGVRLLPMVKANGYGVGALEAARALTAVDPWGFGVATVEEGAELRRGGIRQPIVVFSPLQAQWCDAVLTHELRPVIGDLEALQAWTTQSERPFHLEIDTGMARAGFRWDDEALVAEALSVAASAPGWEGIFTHFQSGDDLGRSNEQWGRFQAVLAQGACRPPVVHAANSAAALAGGSRFAADLVRPGIFLYGGAAAGHTPRAVVRLHAKVLAVRRLNPGDTVSYQATWRAAVSTQVATLGIGYGDGLPRSLSNRGAVELVGQRAEIVGRVTMDMTMVASPVAVPLGATAAVIGGLVTLDEQAALAGTISYELLTSLGARIPRRYSEAP